MQAKHAFGLATFGLGVTLAAFLVNLLDATGSLSLSIQIGGLVLVLVGILLHAQARKEVAE